MGVCDGEVEGLPVTEVEGADDGKDTVGEADTELDTVTDVLAVGASDAKEDDGDELAVAVPGDADWEGEGVALLDGEAEADCAEAEADAEGLKEAVIEGDTVGELVGVGVTLPTLRAPVLPCCKMTGSGPPARQEPEPACTDSPAGAMRARPCTSALKPTMLFDVYELPVVVGWGRAARVIPPAPTSNSSPRQAMRPSTAHSKRWEAKNIPAGCDGRTDAGGCRKDLARAGHTWATDTSCCSPGCRHRLMVPAGRPKLSVKVNVTQVPPHAQYVSAALGFTTKGDKGSAVCPGSSSGGPEQRARHTETPEPKEKQEVPVGHAAFTLHSVQL